MTDPQDKEDTLSHLQYHISCSGWSYSAWQGPFCSLNLENSRWLSYHSHMFEYVEIDFSRRQVI